MRLLLGTPWQLQEELNSLQTAAAWSRQLQQQAQHRTKVSEQRVHCKHTAVSCKAWQRRQDAVPSAQSAAAAA
jgi:hypothetical protein